MTPLRLDAAAKQFGLSAKTLRRYRDDGLLAVSRVAGKDWTTEAAMLELFEKCRVPPKAQDFICAPRVVAVPRSAPPSGSFAMAERKLAQAATARIAQALNKPSPPTSSPNGGRRAANATSPRSPSPT